MNADSTLEIHIPHPLIYGLKKSEDIFIRSNTRQSHGIITLRFRFLNECDISNANLEM